MPEAAHAAGPGDPVLIHQMIRGGDADSWKRLEKSEDLHLRDGLVIFSERENL